jgi:hypothetical protein
MSLATIIPESTVCIRVTWLLAPRHKTSTLGSGSISSINFLHWHLTFANIVRCVLLPWWIPATTHGTRLTAVQVSLRSVKEFRSLVAILH